MGELEIRYEGTPFLDTSTTNAIADRLNWRCELLLTRNKHAVAGKRVLDLASHDGRFSYASLELGAAHVTGVEGRADLVEHATRNCRELGYAEDRFRFLPGDLFEHLPTFEPGSFDTVLCFGFLYHTIRQVELVRAVKRLRPRHFILDTAVHQEGRAIKLYRLGRALRPKHLAPRSFRKLLESLEGESLVFKSEHHQIQGATIDPNDYVATPTRSLVESLLRVHGFEAEPIPWNEDGRDWTSLRDYQRGRRVSYACTLGTA